MPEEEEYLKRLYQQGYDPIVEAIRILARYGRQLREAEERNASAPEAEEVLRDPDTANAATTQLEWESLKNEWRRQSEQTDILLWNIEHHRYLLNRVNSIADKLTEEEQRAITDLLQSCRWGSAELAQVKELIETAEWFSKLKAE